LEVILSLTLVDVIYNADQTAVNYETVPKKTIDGIGAKTIWIRNTGAEKKRNSVMLLGRSDGIKKAPWIVFKSENAKKVAVESENRQDRNGFGAGVWKEVKKVMNDTGMVIHRNSNGWWTSELTVK
jgi:hypothetical protein